MITKKSTNEELLANEEINAVLKSGDVAVVAIQDTQNPEFKTLFLAQQVNLGNSSINNAQALLLGFNNQIQRCVQNVSAENAEMLETGSNLNELFDTDFALEIKDSYEPNPDFKHKPRQTKNHKTKQMENLVCKDTGKPIYRESELVTSDVVEHSVIKTVLESEYKGKSVKTKEILDVQA